MAAKAALMGDRQIFDEIDAADDPAGVKALGRCVKNFDDQLWKEHLEEIAFEVVKQKFAADAAARGVLLSTGDAIIAEAAPNDRIWGIGLSMTDSRVQDPAQWQGRNFLGQALMRARDHLRRGAVAAAEASSEQPGSREVAGASADAESAVEASEAVGSASVVASGKDEAASACSASTSVDGVCAPSKARRRRRWQQA